MTLAGIRALKLAVVVVPLAAIFLLLHFLGPDLQREHRLGTLPDGYSYLGEFGPYDLYARPDNHSAREAGRVLEEFRRAVFDEFGSVLGLEMPESRFGVIVFSDRADLVEYAKGQLGSDFERNAGFYMKDWRVMAVVGSRSVAQIVRPLFHEGAHMLLDSCVAGGGHEWSRWLNEGFAVYLEASAIRTDGTIVCGGVDEALFDEVRVALRTGAWIPFEEIIAAASTDFEGERNLLFYGEAALFVHYMMEADDRAHRSGFLEYLEEERRPGPVSPFDFERYFGELSAIETALQRHLLAVAIASEGSE